MNQERGDQERKEREPSLSEVLMGGLGAILFAARAVNHIEQHKTKMKQELENSFEQFLRHPDLADRIAINLSGDWVSRLQEDERKNIEERTAIHQKTVGTVARFHQQQAAHQAATQQEQEATRESQDAARDIDETIASGLRGITARIKELRARINSDKTPTT